MLIAMNPFIALIYQIFKGLAWLISRNKNWGRADGDKKVSVF
jgi:hypothetical protein